MICTLKPLAKPRKALAKGVWQWDLSAPGIALFLICSLGIDEQSLEENRRGIRLEAVHCRGVYMILSLCSLGIDEQSLEENRRGIRLEAVHCRSVNVIICL